MDLVSKSVNDLTVRSIYVSHMMKRQNTEFVGGVKREEQREGDYQNGCELGSNDGTS